MYSTKVCICAPNPMTASRLLWETTLARWRAVSWMHQGNRCLPFGWRHFRITAYDFASITNTLRPVLQANFESRVCRREITPYSHGKWRNEETGSSRNSCASMRGEAQRFISMRARNQPSKWWRGSLVEERGRTDGCTACLTWRYFFCESPENCGLLLKTII